MILEIYRDPYSGAMGFEVMETMNEIERLIPKKFTKREEENIMETYWEDGMVNLADFLTDGQIDKLLEIG